MYTQTKRDQFTDSLCDEAGIDYQPIVFGSFGGVCEEGFEILKSLNHLVAVDTTTPTSEVAQRFWQKVAGDIQKSSHRPLLSR